MTKTIAVDTNVLLDYRLKRRPGFSKIERLINDCLSGNLQIFIPDIVFPELEWVLRSYYKEPKEKIIEFLEELLSLEGVIMREKIEIEQALLLFQQINIKLTDAIILNQIQSFRPDEFLTFDENLKKIYQEYSSQN